MGHSGKRLASPSARVRHSGKRLRHYLHFFPECPIFGTRGSPEHSGNFHSPVVVGPHARNGTCKRAIVRAYADKSTRTIPH
jgi:hypothetical protein